MHKNDFVTSITSTNVRSALNDSFGSRAEIVQNACDTVPHRSLHAYNKGCNKVIIGINIVKLTFSFAQTICKVT